jgi:CO/xanthine dehydrogenase FAD-binding subunit
MNIHSVEEVWRPTSLDDVNGQWREGDSWLAGGTWLFSEPQPVVRRLVDLIGLGWHSLSVTDEGLDVAATCTVAELHRSAMPKEWQAAPLIARCCRSFQASFKILNAATVGGNICMSLPAGPMISLASALDGVGTIVEADAFKRQIPIADFVLGDGKNVLQPGELLRSVFIPASALQRRFAFRQMSLTRQGRSTALLIGTLSPECGQFLLTITASTIRPVRLRFDYLPNPEILRDAIKAVPDHLYLSDPHGVPSYRKHLTFLLAEEIRVELSRLERSSDLAP